MAEITAKAAFQHLKKESCLSLYGKTEWDGLGKSIFFFFFNHLGIGICLLLAAVFQAKR